MTIYPAHSASSNHLTVTVPTVTYSISLLVAIFIVASLQFSPGYRLESTDLGSLHGNFVKIARTTTLAKPIKRRPHTRWLSLFGRRDGFEAARFCGYFCLAFVRNFVTQNILYIRSSTLFLKFCLKILCK